MSRRPPSSPLFPYTTLFRSELAPRRPPRRGGGGRRRRRRLPRGARRRDLPVSPPPTLGTWLSAVPADPTGPGLFPPRSEEHTSELQSLRHLVCRLLLEKKNT